jgi:hypothetical protein
MRWFARESHGRGHVDADRAVALGAGAASMSSAHEHDPPDEDHAVAPAEPSEWVKPVELIELLQRRTEKRKQAKAPTSSPFYDAEFVANHRTRRKRRSD